MLRLFQSCVNFADRIFQCLIITLFFGNHFFPVPLIYVDRVNIVRILISADGTHIGVKTFTGMKTVVLECIAFPFCQRMHDLRGSVLLLLDPERNRALHTI